MNKNKSQDSYEKIFEELEKIVQKMDSGDISLEKSLDFFEKGMKLIKEGKEKHGDHYPATDAQIDFIYGPGSVEKEFDRLKKSKEKKK